MPNLKVSLYNRVQQRRYFNKTGIFVDIQNIGTNTKLIAVPEKYSISQVRPGVWLKKKPINFLDGSFTNVYNLSWDEKHSNVIPNILSSNTPYHLYDQIKNDPYTIATVTGGFFFLADIYDSTPKDICLNFCVRDGEIFGLPSWDRPIAYIKNDQLHTYEAKANGIIKIGSKKLEWIGSNSELAKKKAVLYNSKSVEVIKFRDPKTNIQLGMLDNENIHTPKGEVLTDLVVNKVGKKLKITKINKGGGTHFFQGNFIIQIKGSANFNVGEEVTPLTVDGLSLEGITSGITTNKSVWDPFFLDPVRKDRRDARTVLAKDINGHIHFIVFDGSKYVPGFNGVSAEMITPYLSRERYEWAYFLDGGGSARLVTKNEENKLGIHANEFLFKKVDNNTFLWDWEKGRTLASSLSLQIRKQ
jgi:hypothetical protein